MRGFLWWALVNPSSLPNFSRWLHLLWKYENLFLKIGINQNGKIPYYLEKLILPLDSQNQCFLFDCNCCGATTTANGGFLREKKTHFTMENFKFWEAVKWWLKILHQTTETYTLTPNQVEQIVWRMWQWRYFDTIRRREKSTRESPLENRSRL